MNTTKSDPMTRLLIGVIEQAVWDWDQLVLRGKIADPNSGRQVCLSEITAKDVRELKAFFRGPWFAKLLKLAAPTLDAKAAADRILHRTPEEILRNRRDAELRGRYPFVYAWWKAGIRDVETLTQMRTDADMCRNRSESPAARKRAEAYHRKRIQNMIAVFEQPIRLKPVRRKVATTPLETSLV